MTGRPYVAATPLAMELVVWFTLNHDEELTTGDICDKWAVAHESARYTLQRLGSIGVLSLRKHVTGKGGHPQWIASAGPELLRMRGGR